MSAEEPIGVLGAGAWGTALALALARAGRRVLLWGNDPAHVEGLRRARENARHLPGLPLPEAIRPTADLADLFGLGRHLLVTPARAISDAARALSPGLPDGAALLLCAKGLDRASGRFLSDAVAEVAPRARIGALSGPGFAEDVGRGLPTAITLAFPDKEEGMALARALASPSFRPYWTDDLRGVEIGGAMKNVIAIAAGIVIGRGLGESARAALIARGFSETMRLGLALGARMETFTGLSGLGDLILTATSEQSRNVRFGLALGVGEGAASARARIGTVEGADTALIAADVAARRGLDVPITAEIARVIRGEDDVEAAIERLIRRPLKAEVEGG